jgi:hypothetical protein
MSGPQAVLACFPQAIALTGTMLLGSAFPIRRSGNEAPMGSTDVELVDVAVRLDDFVVRQAERRARRTTASAAALLEDRSQSSW